MRTQRKNIKKVRTQNAHLKQIKSQCGQSFFNKNQKL